MQRIGRSSLNNGVMNSDLSNQVIARLVDADDRSLPRRSLDLGNILTPELGLLSPRRSEIAPKGAGRDAALIAYSERLRHSYKRNEGGIREGMLKLADAYNNGQTVAVSCFCRAGDACHADVVKMAIEKVGGAMKAREVVAENPARALDEHKPSTYGNPRTQRAINEILSFSRSEMLLATLEDTEGRNRSEHASYLNGHSQFVRDAYERGSVVRDGALISPKDVAAVAPPLTVATSEYAVKRLSTIVGEERAKKLAPRIVEHGNAIAGRSADRDTAIKVFKWMYEALEGRNRFLPSGEGMPEHESKEEKFERTLTEISRAAEEMSRLEPSDKLLPMDHQNQHATVHHDQFAPGESNDSDIEHDLLEATESVVALQEFDRFELADPTLSRLSSAMSAEELNRWTEVRLPVIDEELESGAPVESILKIYQNGVYHAAKEGPAEKQSAIDDLKFASAYVRHQLKQPETRMRHYNPRYREYAAMLEGATSRSEVIDAASTIRLENARIGFQWEKLSEAEKAKTDRPLTAKEMQFLFSEASPRHYTSEMNATKLSYLAVGHEARAKTGALMRAEIAPSPEAVQLIDSLESRVRRRDFKDSLAATRHFLASLNTSNDELRYKNEFDHKELYQRLPAAERDFVYQRAVQQKQSLESKLAPREKGDGVRVSDSTLATGELYTALKNADLAALRSALKDNVVELVGHNPDVTTVQLAERTSLVFGAALAKIGFSDVEVKCEIDAINREMGEGVVNGLKSINVNQHRRDVNQHMNSRNSSGDTGSRGGATQERFSDRFLTR